MILDELNSEQLEVVQSNRNLLLTACPGSGKTRVIINKIAHELSLMKSESKRKILTLTFTNRASDEITRRLNRLGVLTSEVWSGTIHSFCMEWIIKPYAGYLDELRNGFTIVDEKYISSRITELKEEHNIGFFDNVNMKIERNGEYSCTNVSYIPFLDNYYNGLKESKMIDFELLLHYSNKLLARYPKISNSLAKIFKYILVDEFQDTQDIQYSIISHIIKNSDDNSNVIFVGDIDQAIYTSLGGVAMNFEELKVEIDDSNMESKTLTGNYRSAQRIIDFYSHFQSNELQIQSEANIPDESTLISLNRNISKEQIPNEIARLIQFNLNNGIPESEICVLVPQWWLITSITRRLRQLLPEVNFDASGITPMSQIRENFWYKVGRLFLTEPLPKMYSARYKWAEEIIELFKLQTNRDMLDTPKPEKILLRIINSINPNKTEGIEYLAECFDELLSELNIDLSFFPDLVSSKEIYFETIETRLQDETYDVPTDTESFKKFYRENSGIVINTCVGVKGEEFETVISYGLLYGYVPHWNEIYNGNPDSASKKLLYVICSRAKRNLHLIAETGRQTRRGVELGINRHLGEVEFDYDDI
ncbi:UvrD-helicase domain-containing protein [Flammeovirga yaeyamensis]|uniref:UvrD-helicase domain-containing protein n=1 Tax=Flammeovirga yaeyamensis TaxID=367791 RepID=A0AAX1NBW7_9BACT|nr:ATP-dependent helicase [Flammeovirga yaeyamensis]MBB3697736.1 superfamily I DNA/RNA helicase [Flammeovirga yaeyamensis]NMF35907.1 ATP-dependent helicase [Flammeovirga yaeyamensis]QWG03143.1 UvrD-helicase domain-containing protein [Flammeovirga yaeyamensis]